MLSLKSKLISIVSLLLVGCASPPQVAYKPAQVPPLPPEIAVKRQANLTERLTQILVPVEPAKKKIITPESIAMATTALAGIGSSGLTSGEGPVQYALAAIAVLAFVIGAIWYFKKRV